MNMLSMNLQELVNLAVLKEKEFLDSFNPYDEYGALRDIEDILDELTFEFPAKMLRISKGEAPTDTTELMLECYLDPPRPSNQFLMGIGIDFPMDAHFVNTKDSDIRLHKLQLIPCHDMQVAISSTILNNTHRVSDEDFDDWTDCTGISAVQEKGTTYYIDVNNMNTRSRNKKHNLLYSLGIAFNECDLPSEVSYATNFTNSD